MRLTRKSMGDQRGTPPAVELALHELWPGVRGLELGPLGLKLGRNKLVVHSREGEGEHLTVLFETRSGEFDVHWTTADRQHEPLVRLPADRLGPVLNCTAEIVAPLFLSLLRPLRLGWLSHHGIGVVVQPNLDARALAGLGQQRRHVLRLDVERVADTVIVPESLESLYELVGRAFLLVATRRPRRGQIIGTAFSVQRPTGAVTAHWIKTRDFNHFRRAVAATLQESARAEGAFVAETLTALGV